MPTLKMQTEGVQPSYIKFRDVAGLEEEARRAIAAGCDVAVVEDLKPATVIKTRTMVQAFNVQTSVDVLLGTCRA